MKKITLLGFVLLSIFSFSQTHTWTGNGGDNYWNNPDNWDVFSVPDGTSDVLISGNGIIVDVSANNEGGTIVIQQGARLIVNGTLTSQQTLTLNNAEIEVIGTLQNNGGIIVIEPGATLIVEGSITNGVPNEIEIADGGELIFLDGILQGGIIENDGTILIESSEMKEMHDVILNNRSEILILDSGTISLYGITTINNAHGAEININSPGGLIEDSGVATVNNDGLIRRISNGGPGAFYMIFDMNNSGIILLDEEQIFLFLVGSQNFTNNEDGFLIGNGSYDITANFVNNGYVYPGGFHSVGALEFVNNFHFPPNAILEVDVMSPSEHDMVHVFGSPTIEGNIRLYLMDELALDDEITVITSSNNLNCNLPTEILASTTNFSYIFDVICDSNSVTLKVSEIMELLGTDEFTKTPHFFVNPNPASEIISFNYASEILQQYENLQIEIYSILGQKIEAKKVASEVTQVETSQLTSGIYIAKLVSEKGVLGATNFIVE
ncbi:MAG TPA: hypothetical protein DCS66_06755 [Flavobacteriaceae bacterium]|nr:hypothetical protein [Flavobacteriaceae bacterium]HAT64288.1 hypothetical protein [Flavobacteriaceae bacterium]|tara:strand:+ start:252919 stop:254403 length:1485 start_codon:yes stop_codon:yes gene_type:complete